MKKGDLSKFIERAVQKEILAQTAADVKQRNTDLSEKELEALIDEAVSAVRAEMRSEAKVKTKVR
jgi:ribosomal protein S13